jgi:ABC-type multidrug transport system fused ATPase/permease subunit
VKAPDILVLDEPASALDSATERSIFDALPAQVRGMTLFIVTHRLYTAYQADRILLLNDKRLVATGTHQELMASNAYYRSLVLSQQGMDSEAEVKTAGRNIESGCEEA